MQLRENLAYGEHVPPPPRSRLGEDASALEAEAFIISRPWFIYIAERIEFIVRRNRIPVERRGRQDPEDDDQVTK